MAINIEGFGKKTMAEEKKARKRPIEQYHHKGKQRVNNPPVGLVTPERDQDRGKKTYAYDPHIDPALQFDSQGGFGKCSLRESNEIDKKQLKTLQESLSGLSKKAVRKSRSS